MVAAVKLALVANAVAVGGNAPSVIKIQILAPLALAVFAMEDAPSAMLVVPPFPLVVVAVAPLHDAPAISAHGRTGPRDLAAVESLIKRFKLIWIFGDLLDARNEEAAARRHVTSES